MSPSSLTTEIKGVGPELAKQLLRFDIKTVADLIHFYPRRYDDYSTILPISHIKPGVVTIKAVIKQAKGRYVRRGMHITEAIASDDTSSVRLIWFNQPYRAAALKADTEYFISGEFKLSHQRLSIMNPSVELVSDFPVSTARIVPIYRESKALKSNQVRKAMRQLAPIIIKIKETLPNWIIEDQKFISYSEALLQMHFPASLSKLEQARRRLGFEEVFGLTLAALLNKQALLHEQSMKIEFVEPLAKNFVSHLPFDLTNAQRKTIWQIYQDMKKTVPMNRLVEGDVGAGKTVVAAMAALMSMAADFQIALMAPTELLAKQHAETLYKLLQPLGQNEKVGLLVGGMSAAQKKLARQNIAKGSIKFIIGTHAIFQEKVDMHRLGLVIVDEQHRFGVEQRKALQAKAGHMPHVLSMTATPIPRSLALTLYGDLDISVLDEMPAGRKPIITKLIPPSSRTKLLHAIDKQLGDGQQAFVVCPLISESDSLNIKSAEQVYDELSRGVFKARKVELLHGKMKAEAKEQVMAKFVRGELDVLVATTVIEVGVDVPNATIMVIESPERFGLAQIHQLRGRVGRSDRQSHCYIMLSDSMEPSQRLKALASTADGFKLAELDLELRGPGAIYGTQQHGQLDLRVAKLSDTKLIAAARACAQQFIDKQEDLLNYKQLLKRVMQNRAVTNLN